MERWGTAAIPHRVLQRVQSPAIWQSGHDRRQPQLWQDWKHLGRAATHTVRSEVCFLSADYLEYFRAGMREWQSFAKNRFALSFWRRPLRRELWPGPGSVGYQSRVRQASFRLHQRLA